MEVLVCPRSLFEAVIHYLLRLPEYLHTFSPKIQNILEGGFMDSFLID
jgi:hypothetical protein